MGLKATTVAVLLGSLAATGCATKGALRESEARQQAALKAGLDAERSERQSADDSLQAELTQLRSDLNDMKTKFNAQIEAVAQGMKFVLPVHFAYDDSQVRPQDQDALNAFASVVNKHYTGAVVTVEGFADPAGSASYNKKLGMKRAESVRDQLVQVGIQAQVRPVSYGETRQVVEGAKKDDPGAELNRRVVFVIESPSQGSPVATLDRPTG